MTGLTPSPRASVVLVALLCLGLGWALGRLGPEAGEAGPSYLAQLTEALRLRPEQVAAVDAILVSEDERLQALVSEHRVALQGPVALRRQATEDALLVVLDEAQRERYRSLSAPEGPR